MNTGSLHQVFWQNPYVDIFKNWPLTDKANADKQGEIVEQHDKALGKKVIKISGNVSASNYLAIPSKKNNSKSLGLVGRYIYLQCMSNAGSLFSFHFEYFCMGKSIKLSFSNLFKSVKVISETNVQIPFKENITKWSILCIDSKALIRELFILNQDSKKKTSTVSIPEEKNLDLELQALQICSKISVRGIFTSDTYFTSKTFPKEINYRVAKGEDFDKSYPWINLDSFLNPDILSQNKTSNKENSPSKQNTLEDKPDEVPIKLEKTEKLESQPISKPEITSNKPSKPALKPSVKPSTTSKPKTKPVGFSDQDQEAPEPHTSIPQREEQKVSHDLDQSTVQDGNNTKAISFKSPHFTLEPNPIMSLAHFQGFQSNARNLQFVDETKIVYSCGNTICLMDIKSKYQKFFIGQQQTVKTIAVNQKENVLVSIDESDKECKVYLWSIFPQKLETSFNSGLKSVNACDIGVKKDAQRKIMYLIVSGKDQLNRCVVAVHDITDFAYKEPYLHCKQISDFDIKAMKFVNKRDANLFITCGKENIRFWRIKHKVITGNSIVLGEHARGTVFNDFTVFNYEENTSTEETNYKVLACSDKGNIYLVDYKGQELIGIYKLHDTPITTINVNPANHYIISAGEDKMIRLWNMDVTQMLLEVKCDSQVNHLLINKADQIVCGCMNGTIGELLVDEKKMDFLVRSHNDTILMMDYHPLTKNLVTISRDLTIKIWDVHLGYLAQKFEFRCIDEQVTYIKCMQTRELFICGFESGNLRIFDILKCQVLGELEGHSAQIIDIEVSPEDKFIASVDITGKIQIFDQNLNFIKDLYNEIKYQAQYVSFDFYNQYLLTRYNPNTVRVYNIGNWLSKYTISIEEEIVKASFSSSKGDLFILTSKAKLKKCKLSFGEVKVEREYWSLHNGNITDFQISKNCRYIFTIGEDNLLKVWDYFMRGKLTPAYQAYTIGTTFRDVLLTNDDTNLIFTFGLHNHGIFCFEFKSDMIGAFEEEAIEQTPEPTKEESFMVRQYETIESSHLAPTNQSNFMSAYNTGEVRSIFQNTEDMLGLPSSTINLKNNIKNEPVKEEKPFKEERSKFQETFKSTEAYEPETTIQEKSIVDRAVERQMAEYKRVTFQENEKYYFNEENLQPENLNPNKYLEPEEPEHSDYKLPGQYMAVEYVIGGSFEDNYSNLVWNSADNYIAHSIGPSIIITFLEEPKTQHYLSEQHSDDIAFLRLSAQRRFLVSASKEAKNEASCNITVWDATKLCYLNTMTHSHLAKIISIDISPCENYVLVLGQSRYDENALVYLWETQSGLMVTNTMYLSKCARYVKWNHVIKGALEFTMLTDDNVVLWRLNFKRNLEFQDASFDRVVMKGHKYVTLDYCETKLFKDTSFMFVGTSQGALMVFDTRSNTLLFTYNNFIKGPIMNIFSPNHRLIVTGADANVYSWKLDKCSDAEDIAKQIQNSPDILLADSRPTSGHFLVEKHGDEGVICTKGGIIWYFDWEERATLRLITTHVSNTHVTSIKSHYMPDKETLLLSSSTDGTVRVWSAHTLEQQIEFHVPRREALCLDIHKESNKCVCGFSDGYVRFFDYRKNINYGGTLLYVEPPTDPKRKLDDKPKPAAVTAVTFLNHEFNVLAGNMNGEVFIIYIRDWESMRIEVKALVSSAGFPIHHIARSEIEPWDTWLISTKNRKVMVWNRKDLSPGNRRDESYYKKAFQKINELEYYLIDNYKVHSKDEKESNFDNLALDVDANNKWEYQGDTIAVFSKKPDLCVVMTNQIPEIFFRDFRAHMVFKTVKIQGYPRSLVLKEAQSELIVGTKDGLVRFVDYETGIERDKVSVSQDSVKNLEMCLPAEKFNLETLKVELQDNDHKMLMCSTKNAIFMSRLAN